MSATSCNFVAFINPAGEECAGRSRVAVANYASGSVAALPVKADGSLGEKAAFVQHKGPSVNPQRQKEPHAHCIVVSPDNKYAFAADRDMPTATIAHREGAVGLIG